MTRFIQLLFCFSFLVHIISSCSVSKKQATTTEHKPTNTANLPAINISYFDTLIKPSDDFYTFCNGTWLKNNPVPASEARWGSVNELEQANLKKLTAILTELNPSKAEEKSDAHLLGSYYQSFLDTAERNNLGIKPIEKELNRINGILSYADYCNVVAEQHKYGISSLFSLNVAQDLKENTKHISYLSQAGIGLPNKDYYLNPAKKELKEKYRDHIKNIFVLVGYTEENALKAANNSLDFETKLATKMMSPAELRFPEKFYTKYKKEDVDQLLVNFDFERYLVAVGSQTFDELVVDQPEFIKTINSLVVEQPIEAWKDYLAWRTLNHYSGHLGLNFTQEKFRFYQGVLSGKTAMKSLNDQAISEISALSIGEVLGHFFIEKHFSPKAMQRVNELVDNLLSVYNERIQHLDWMSDSTKIEALNKLNAIGRKLGYPTHWEDFSDLKLNSKEYIQNIKKIKTREVSKNFSELYHPIDKNKWEMPAHKVNAYYHPSLNEIAFPAGIMQYPFFDENAEEALNYARIGMIIGHEFTHGFDDSGAKFAANGSYSNWWNQGDKAAFDTRTKLLGETFEQFCPIEGHCVNPNLTMGENIADLGGVTLAYYAYKKTAEFKAGKIIEGFNPSQRFFISFGQLYKINYTQAELKSRIANDPHSPGMYRVNGTLKNCPEFFTAFSIPEGSKMRNSTQKLAKIW